MTKNFCDCCGAELPAWNGANADEAISRRVEIRMAGNVVPLDACAGCFEKLKSAIATVATASPRSEWGPSVGDKRQIAETEGAATKA